MSYLSKIQLAKKTVTAKIMRPGGGGGGRGRSEFYVDEPCEEVFEAIYTAQDRLDEIIPTLKKEDKALAKKHQARLKEMYKQIQKIDSEMVKKVMSMEKEFEKINDDIEALEDKADDYRG